MKKNFINKRKKNILFSSIFSLIFFILISLSIIFFYLNIQKINNTFADIIQDYSDKYDYNLLKIEILNLNYIEKKEILKYFNKYKSKSIFLIPINDIAKNITHNKWIKNLQIKIDYKNTLIINLQEEIPFGIYSSKGQKILFSDDLIILEVLKNQNEFSNLIIYYGKNSIINSKDLIRNFDDNFKKSILSAKFIENRRWNLRLKNSIILKLSTNNIGGAIKKYKKIYAKFSNNDLRDVESIDLRITNQAIIKYKNIND